MGNRVYIRYCCHVTDDSNLSHPHNSVAGPVVKVSWKCRTVERDSDLTCCGFQPHPGLATPVMDSWRCRLQWFPSLDPGRCKVAQAHHLQDRYQKGNRRSRCRGVSQGEILH